MGTEKTSKSGRKYRNDPLSPNGIQFEDDFDTSLYDDAFLGTDYEDLYKATLQQYQYEPQRAFLGNLTGKNQENSYNHDQARSDALNALLDQKRQDEYNDPMSQVARDKAAGLNPDLQGLSGEGQTEDATSGEPNKASPAMDVVPHILSFMQMVGSAALKVQSGITQDMVNEGIELDNVAKAKTLALQGLSGIDPIKPFDKNELRASFSLDFPTLSRRRQKKLRNLASNLYGSVEHELAWRKANKDKASLRQELFDVQSSPGYSESDETMTETAKFLADNQLLVEKARIANDKEKQKIIREIFNNEQGYIKKLRERAAKGEKRATNLLLRICGNDATFDGNETANTAANVAGAAVNVGKAILTKGKSLIK